MERTFRRFSSHHACNARGGIVVKHRSLSGTNWANSKTPAGEYLYRNAEVVVRHVCRHMVRQLFGLDSMITGISRSAITTVMILFFNRSSMMLVVGNP